MFPYRELNSADVQEFHVNSMTDGVGWTTWRKRPGVSMIQIFCLGGGGGGGNGVVGANSTAAGGGGGSSATLVIVNIPAALLPDVLFVSVGAGGISNADGIRSYVSVQPNNGSSFTVAAAEHGWAGGNGSGATGGAAGAAANALAATNMRLGWSFVVTTINGQAGIIGGTTGVGNNITQANTGLLVTGGASGAGLPAAAAVGNAGGLFTGFSTNFPFPTAGGVGGATATTPPGDGSAGYRANQWGYWFGGCGGGSSHGSATGAGLVGGNGGPGAYGCGGGGGGGALTGSVQGKGGKGGDGLIIITQW